MRLSQEENACTLYVHHTPVPFSFCHPHDNARIYLTEEKAHYTW